MVLVCCLFPPFLFFSLHPSLYSFCPLSVTNIYWTPSLWKVLHFLRSGLHTVFACTVIEELGGQVGFTATLSVGFPYIPCNKCSLNIFPFSATYRRLCICAASQASAHCVSLKRTEWPWTSGGPQLGLPLCLKLLPYSRGTFFTFFAASLVIFWELFSLCMSLN